MNELAKTAIDYFYGKRKKTGWMEVIAKEQHNPNLGRACMNNIQKNLDDVPFYLAEMNSRSCIQECANLTRIPQPKRTLRSSSR